MLELQGLRLTYGREDILQDLSLRLEEGEFLSLVGPSGCGKSTLLAAIAGSLLPAAGSILLDGSTQRAPSQQLILMPQDDLLLPWMTVLDNVCLYARLHGGLKEAYAEARAALPLFGLEAYEKRYPHELSGGMRQRTAFLRTALSPARLLLLDEPFASLDVITREELQDWLISLRGRLERTILLVTHDIDEALYLSDRVLVLGGRPARLSAEFHLPKGPRDRTWLFDQGDLRRAIYVALQEGKGDGES